MNVNLSSKCQALLFQCPYRIPKRAPKQGRLHTILANFRRRELEKIFYRIAPIWLTGPAVDEGFLGRDYALWLEKNLPDVARSFETYGDMLDVGIWHMFIDDENAEKEGFNKILQGLGEEAREVEGNILLKIYFFVEQGLAFLFGETPETLQIVIPSDYSFHQVYSASRNGMAGFSNYCRVAANLYGLATAESITRLWNRDHKKQLTEKQIEKHLEKCAFSSPYFNYIDGGLTDARIRNFDQIDDILERRKSKPEFLPSKEEIEEWSVFPGDINQQIPECKSLESAVMECAKTIPPFEIMVIIVDSLIRGDDPVGLLKSLIDLEYLNIKNIEKMKELTDAFFAFNNHCRMWTNYGFSPDQIVSNVPNFSTSVLLNQNSSKIGRNDPCPCGSGLKYKKCCMLKS